MYLGSLNAECGDAAEALSDEIREQSSKNLDYLVVMIPSCLNAEDVRVALLMNGFVVSDDDSYKDTFEVSW